MKSQSSETETELFGDFFYIYWPREIDWCVHVGMLPSNSQQDHFIDYPYEPLYNLPLLGCWVKTSAKKIRCRVFFNDLHFIPRVRTKQMPTIGTITDCFLLLEAAGGCAADASLQAGQAACCWNVVRILSEKSWGAKVVRMLNKEKGWKRDVHTQTIHVCYMCLHLPSI